MCVWLLHVLPVTWSTLRYLLAAFIGTATLMQVDELDQSNNELEDTNTRLEARAQHAESQASKLQQELQEVSAQVCCAAMSVKQLAIPCNRLKLTLFWKPSTNKAAHPLCT